MTTNHRPTFESRRGREILTNIVHKRALPAHKHLKYRKERQALDELKKELLDREERPLIRETKSLEASNGNDEQGEQIEQIEGEKQMTYEQRAQKVQKEFKSIDDSDDSDNSTSDSDTDEEEELLRELEKLKKEKAAKSKQASIVSNPLLDLQSIPTKKNWRQTAIFKNNSTYKQGKDHVNDLLRSEFHSKFMEKYFR